jgi:hypothetical protein
VHFSESLAPHVDAWVMVSRAWAEDSTAAAASFRVIITDRLCAMTSCISRAIRARSAATATCARLSRSRSAVSARCSADTR